MKGIAIIAGFLLLEAAFLFHAALPGGVALVAAPVEVPRPCRVAG